MVLEVKGCSDCLFMSDTHSSCMLQAMLDNRTYRGERDYIECDENTSRVTPEWCPLKKNNGILIKLNAGNTLI